MHMFPVEKVNVELEKINDRYRLKYRKTLLRPDGVSRKLFRDTIYTIIKISEPVIKNGHIDFSMNDDTAEITVELEGRLDELADFIVSEMFFYSNLKEMKLSDLLAEKFAAEYVKRYGPRYAATILCISEDKYDEYVEMSRKFIEELINSNVIGRRDKFEVIIPVCGEKPGQVMPVKAVIEFKQQDKQGVKK